MYYESLSQRAQAEVEACVIAYCADGPGTAESLFRKSCANMRLPLREAVALGGVIRGRLTQLGRWPVPTSTQQVG